MKFTSTRKRNLVTQGQAVMTQVNHFTRAALGIQANVVQSSPHFILSGPPGISKSHTVRQLARDHAVQHVVIKPGTSDFNLMAQVALARYLIPAEQWLTVILDDADQVVFRDYDAISKWRLALDAEDPGSGYVPTLSHNKNNTVNIRSLPSDTVRAAVSAFLSPGTTSLSIPTNRIRFVVLCNIQLDGRDRSDRIRQGKAAIRDRVTYRRITASSEQLWGICAHLLSNTQPYAEASLTDKQKLEILDWMYANLEGIADVSFRTVRKLAGHMLNSPDQYESFWDFELNNTVTIEE